MRLGTTKAACLSLYPSMSACFSNSVYISLSISAYTVHQAVSLYLCLRWPVSLYLRLHQPVSLYILSHQPFPVYLCLHQPFPIYVCLHAPKSRPQLATTAAVEGNHFGG